MFHIRPHDECFTLMMSFYLYETSVEMDVRPVLHIRKERRSDCILAKSKNTPTYKHRCTHIHMHACAYTHANIHMHKYTWIHTYAHSTHICMPIIMCISTYIYKCSYMHTDTHAHTHTYIHMQVQLLGHTLYTHMY